MKKLYFDMNYNARNTNLGQVEKCDSVKLEIKLLQDVDYSDSSFRLLGNKADKNKVEQKDNYISKENKVIFTLKREFLTCPGIVKLELNISTNIEEYTTSMFYFFVSDTINSKIIESIEDVETIQELENYIKNANDNLDKVSETSKELDYLNSKIKPEEEKRLQAEAMRLQNEKFRNIDEHNRKSSEKIREENEDSRNTSEEERVINEETRKNNELKRKTAENLRVSRENSREEAELQRQNLFEENESVRNESENARIKNETLRIKSEKVRITNEDNRILQEENRSNNEETREISENARIEAEKIREQQEDHREQHYNSFNEAENERVSNEEKRQEAEIIRNTGEESRNTKYEEAELVRNTSFEEAEKNRSRIYNEAEDERTENEKNRIIAESKRNTKEDVRVKAEETRVSAETKRVEAEKLRATSEEERQAYIEETVKLEVQNIKKYDNRITKNTNDIKENAKDIERAFETINDNSFIPFTGENISVEHSKVGFTKDMQIEGMTYQNIFTSTYEGKIKLMNATFDNSTNLITFTPVNSYYCNAWEMNCPNYKPNTFYTVVIDIIENTLIKTPNSLDGDCNILIGGHPKESIIKETYAINVANKKVGRFINKVMTISDFSVLTENFGSRIFLNNAFDGGTLKFKIMILEGDYTNSYIPSYFKSIKSVGEKEKKISILSKNKNLLNIDDFYNTLKALNENRIFEEVKDNRECIKITQGYAYWGDGSHNQSEKGYLNIKFKEGVQYTFSGYAYHNSDNPAILSIYYTDGTYKDIGILPGEWRQFKFTSIKGKTIRGIYSTATTDTYAYIDKNTFIIEEGTEATDFEPYKINKKEILLPFLDGLKGLPNGVKDLIYNKDDGCYVKQKIGTLKLDETIEWMGEARKGNGWAMQNVNLLNKKSTPNGLSNTLPIVLDYGSDSNVFNCLDLVTIPNKIIFKIMDSTSGLTSGSTVEEIRAAMKKYFKENPTTVYYELAEPIEHEIVDLNSINLETFKDITHVSSENEIQPNLSFKAPVDVPAVISNLKLKNNTLEKENKQLKEELDTKTLRLHDQDVELTNSDLDLDFRIFELEMNIGLPINLNIKGVKNMARSPFEMMKILILNNNYDREDIEYKASRYLQGKRITQAEYDEIISLMDANELVK